MSDRIESPAELTGLCSRARFAHNSQLSSHAPLKIGDKEASHKKKREFKILASSKLLEKLLESY